MELCEEDGVDGSSLLRHLDHILCSDPLIDEVGFVHPSQLASLHETSFGSAHSSSAFLESKDDNSENGSRLELPPYKSAFWCADHKLAIAVPVLPPLLKAATAAFLAVRKQYGHFRNSQKVIQQVCPGDADNPSNCDNFASLEEKLMTYTRVLVIINSGHRSAWNIRKQILNGAQNEVLVADLKVSSLTLSHDPKCEEAWAHRRWVIMAMVQSTQWGHISEHLLYEELKLVQMVAERSRMNYRAWRHCCWLVPLMPQSQVLVELQQWKEWARLHVADNCCLHFRRCLFQQLSNNGKFTESDNIFQDEIKWNEGLIKLYIGREALWVHRRFLFFMWIQHFKFTEASIDNISSRNSFNSQTCGNESRHLHKQQFPEAEVEFANTCISTCNGDETEDAERQIVFAATYKLWVLLKWNKSGTCNTSVSEMWRQNELFDVKQLLVRKGAHQINLWNGLFQEYAM